MSHLKFVLATSENFTASANLLCVRFVEFVVIRVVGKGL
jgi:hypothetical protein